MTCDAENEVAPGRHPAFLEKYRIKIAVAFLLTFASGLVDIVGYLGIFRLFTAHMTGATVQLARNAVGGNWVGARAAAVVVASFFLGSVVGRAIIQAGSRKRLRRVASITLLLEAALVFGTAWAAVGLLPLASATQRQALLGCLAASMGLQTATLTGIGPLTVHTTFVTGMLNKLAQFVSRIAFRTYDFIHFGSADLETSLAQKNDKQEAIFVFLIWSLYLGGAAVGSWLYQPWGLRTLYLGVMLLLPAIAIDQFHPLSLEEEREQSER